MAGMRHLREGELEALLEACERVFTWQLAMRCKSMFMLQAATGIRAKEVCTLQVGNVSSDLKTANEFITVFKRNVKRKTENRVIPCSPMAKRAIEAWLTLREPLEKSDILFSTTAIGANRHNHKGYSNKAVHSTSYVHFFAQAAKEAGLEPPVNTHSLRKTFAVKFYEASGHNLVACQKALGHSSISTTIAYLEIEKELVHKTIMGLYE